MDVTTTEADVPEIAVHLARMNAGKAHPLIASLASVVPLGESVASVYQPPAPVKLLEPSISTVADTAPVPVTVAACVQKLFFAAPPSRVFFPVDADVNVFCIVNIFKLLVYHTALLNKGRLACASLRMLTSGRKPKTRVNSASATSAFFGLKTSASGLL